LDPNLVAALKMVVDSILSALKNLISYLSGSAVDLVSGVATGVPNLILSLLAMIFSTVFVVGDYEKIMDFARDYIPGNVKNIIKKVRTYLTDTLFVVIRSYLLIMMLTFVELSVMFSIFGISNPFLKAGLIAVLDIMPILGTGGIMIPWAVTSLVLGYVGLGLKLLLIYAIVTVVRNYMEPKIVGTQLGLHPIITLTSMFIGLRLFGFWGLFGLPVGISFLWKQTRQQADPADSKT
jgi:sporulation integral membrane protein YtvI